MNAFHSGPAGWADRTPELTPSIAAQPITCANLRTIFMIIPLKGIKNEVGSRTLPAGSGATMCLGPLARKGIFPIQYGRVFDFPYQTRLPHHPSSLQQQALLTAQSAAAQSDTL